MDTYMQPDLRKRMEDRRRLEAEQVAADWQLLHRADGRQRWVKPKGWMTKKGCWLLCQLGRALVWSGRRLQEVGALAS